MFSVDRGAGRCYFTLFLPWYCRCAFKVTAHSSCSAKECGLTQALYSATISVKQVGVPFPRLSPDASLKVTCSYSPHQGCPFISGSWWPGMLVFLCSWAPWDCNNQKDSSWQATTPRALHRWQTETHFPVFTGKNPVSLFWSSSLRGRLQIYHTSSGYRGAFREHSQCTPSLDPFLGSL